MPVTEAVHDLAPALLREMAVFVAAHFGIGSRDADFADFARAAEAIRSKGRFATAAAAAAWLLAPPTTAEKLDALAHHVTVGETYFFREPKMFDALAHHILPDIARQHHEAGAASLKIWSAGCATGEEAYSLAMMLDSVPALAGWDITIMATDINRRFLAAAHDAVYYPWSFRGVSADVQERFFTSAGNARVLIPRIRDRVKFSHLNLAGDAYMPAGDLHDFDLILCRNVLMYFTPDAARRAVGRLAAGLKRGGCLVVGTAEYSQTLFKEFEPIALGEAMFYRKPLPQALNQPRRMTPRPRKPRAALRTVPSAGLRSVEVAAESAARQARTAADRGAVDDALMWIGRALDADKMDAGLHCLHGQILLEAGNDIAAATALDRAIYLQPLFVLAHYLRATIAQTQGRTARARCHYDNALAALSHRSDDDLVEGSDGLTAGRLSAIIRAASERIQP